MEKKKWVIGLDYGTDSCRAVIVNTENGEELASETACYTRWKAGKYCDPQKNLYRQHPLDYIESMEQAIKGMMAKCPEGTAKLVAGISFDTTGSTPVLLNKEGIPLALLPEFADNRDAMFVLWKDHTAIQEAAEINKQAKEWHTDYTMYSGGVYSSEWVWAKMLHVLRSNEAIRKEAYSWTEHCDWMPALLTGHTRPEEMMRSRCAAGHKAMWNDAWGGLPPFEFWEALDPLMRCFREHLFTDTATSDKSAGTLSAEWAARLGLSTDVKVGIGELDCHMGAVGAEIKPGSFVRVIGTSTCDIMIASYEEMNNKLIAGICGQVDSSVVPGMIGLEAGQSAFGDIFAWYKELLLWPLENLLPESRILSREQKEQLTHEIETRILPAITAEAEKIPVEESSLIAVDWLNGRRTPFADQGVKGCICGLTLGTTAPLLFRALVEATAFGSKAIVDSFLQQGIRINFVIGIGGISLKSPFVMQTLANALGMPIKVAKAEQACALGAAMFAAVAAGIYPTVSDAQQAMGSGFAYEYEPDEVAHRIYLSMYEQYNAIGKFTQEKLYNV